MAKLIEMPKLSDTMEEGGISEWFKKEGDFVEEGELLVAIETDKATMEYASPEEGFLLKILESDKKSLPLGAPMAVLGEKEEKLDLESLLLKTQKKPENKQEKKPLEKPASIPVAEPSFSSSRIKASPLAKRLAKEKGISLESVSGSGPFGRVIVSDVKAFSGRSASFQDGFPSLQEKVEPLTQMRKTIAKRLSESKQGAPHFYLTVSCLTEELSKWRKLLNEGSDEKISMNDLLLFVCSRALTKHPAINSHWTGDSIVHKGSVDISIAVALPEGLITPVLRSCEKKNIWQISKEAKELVGKAKSKNLSPSDYQGGSFTVSNLGMTRIESFTAVINSPQTCILALGRSQKKPFVNEQDKLVAKEMMKMTLSCDHRAVDGYMGALFLETLCLYIENPILLFSQKKE